MHSNPLLINLSNKVGPTMNAHLYKPFTLKMVDRGTGITTLGF